MGQGMARVLSFLAAIWAARVLGVAAFGVFSLAYVVMILTAQIPQVLDSSFVRFHTAESDIEKPILLNVQFWLKMSWLVLACLVMLAVGSQNRLIGVAIAAGGFWGVYNSVIAFFQAQQQYRHLAFCYALPSLTAFSAMAVVLTGIYPPSPFALITALLINYIVLSCGAVVFLYGRMPKPLWTPHVKEYTQRLLKFGGWLLLASFCFVLFQRGDMLLLSLFCSAEAMGKFAVAVRLSNLMAFAVDPIHPIFLPKAGQALRSAESLASYKRKSFLYGFLTAVVAVVVMFFARPIVSFVFGQAYQQASGAFFWLLCGWVMYGFSCPLHFLFYAEHKSKKVFYMNLLMLMVLGAVGAFVIPLFQEAGAALSVAAGYAAGLGYVLLKMPQRLSSLDEDSL